MRMWGSVGGIVLFASRGLGGGASTSPLVFGCTDRTGCETGSPILDIAGVGEVPDAGASLSDSNWCSH